MTGFGALRIFVVHFGAEIFRLCADVAQMWLGLRERERIKTAYFLSLWLRILKIYESETICCHRFMTLLEQILQSDTTWIQYLSYIHFLVIACTLYTV